MREATKVCVRLYIEWNQNSYKNGFGLWVASFKKSGEFTGQCGLVLQEVEGEREVEIGYLFLRKSWGHGLATEAARACDSYAAETLGYKRLISLIDPDNIASRQVAGNVGMKLEKKLAFNDYFKSLSQSRICLPTFSALGGS
jgi:RimJ/RimL family protein N-acetyltransferase